MRYLKNIKSGVVMPRTDLLAKNRPDLMECDAQGNVVSPGMNSAGAPLLLNPITGTVVPATDALRHVKGLIGVYSVEEATAILEQLNEMEPEAGGPVGLRRDPVKFDLNSMTPDVSATIGETNPPVAPGPEEDGSGSVGGETDPPINPRLGLMDEETVRAMKYPELQRLAKELDLNAGEKKEVMVEQVLVAMQQAEVA